MRGEVLVTIPPGRSARQIGDILYKKGLVRRPLSFVFASRLGGLSGQMRAGRYELSPAMPPRQIAALMALGETARERGHDPRRLSQCSRSRTGWPQQKLVDEGKFSDAGSDAGADI